MNTNKNYKTIQSLNKDGVLVEVLQLENLEGATSPQMAQALFFAKQQGLHIRLVKVTLNNAKIKTEAGALYYYKGSITPDIDVKGVGGFLKKSIMGSLTQESLAKPEYSGTGEVWLEPSFKHYLLLELNNQSVIVDKGMFYAATEGINIKPVMQTNLSSAAVGNEGFFQIGIKGSGIVILESEVPESEIETVQICNGEQLKVDGNFAILRSEGVRFSVTKSNKGLISSAMGGEGLLNTFEGEGIVWLATTLPIYHKLAYGGVISNKNSNNV